MTDKPESLPVESKSEEIKSRARVGSFKLGGNLSYANHKSASRQSSMLAAAKTANIINWRKME